MISETSEELITTAPASAASRGSKVRKLNSRTFDFLWKRDSRRENILKKEEIPKNTKEDLVEIKIVDGKAKNVPPNKSLDFFKNIKKHVQVKKLTIRRSKRRTKEIDVTSQQNDSTSNALSDEKNGSDISIEESSLPELNRIDSIRDLDLVSSNGALNIAEVSENECTLKSLKDIAESSLNAEKELEAVNGQSINNVETDDNCASSPRVEHLYANNEIHRLQLEPIADSIVVEHRIQSIDRNAEANINNDNKVKASLAKELLKLRNYGWYWGPISGNEADTKLVSEPDGAFLVRDSSDDRYVLTLSFKSSGKLLHARMEHSGGLFSLCNQSESEGFSSVADLIDYSVNFSQSAVFCYSRPKYPGHPSFPVRLTKPVSRFTQVRSLQYLCRFVIRQNTRLDNIHKLPLPKTIRGYIEESHY